MWDCQVKRIKPTTEVYVEDDTRIMVYNVRDVEVRTSPLSNTSIYSSHPLPY